MVVSELINFRSLCRAPGNGGYESLEGDGRKRERMAISVLNLQSVSLIGDIVFPKRTIYDGELLWKFSISVYDWRILLLG